MISARWQENLLNSVPECRKKSQVYDNHRNVQDMIFDCFKKSYIPEEIGEYNLPTIYCIKPEMFSVAYKGVNVCGLPIEEVGCGIKALAQGLTPGYYAPSRACFEKLSKFIEKKGYYYVGRGLWWHIFDWFCSRCSHWYDIIEAIEHKQLVTVLIKREGDSRNHFTNIIGAINEKAISNNEYACKVENGNDYVFITSDGEFYSLEELMKIIKTAPWKWNN